MGVNYKVTTAREFLALHPGFGELHELSGSGTGSPASCLAVLKNFTRRGKHGVPVSPFGDILRDSLVHEHEDQMPALAAEEEDAIAFAVPGDFMPLYGRWADGFWHWMLECFPMVLLAEEFGYRGKYIVPPDFGFIYECFDLLGIAEERVIDFSGESYQVERLSIIPRINGTLLRDYPRLLLAMRAALLKGLKGARPAECGKGPSRIYISRNKTSRPRKIVNEDVVLALCKEFGFETVYLEEMRLPDQILAFENASAVIGPHGAGFVHALFMKPGSLVVELFSPKYIHYTSFAPVSALGHRYFPLVGEYYSPDSPCGDDVVVQEHILRHTLKTCL